MTNNKVVDNELVDKYHAEDTIFNNCMNDFSEFPQYITGYDDIISHFPTKHLDPAFRNLNLDSIMQRENGDLVNMEHHSEITPNIMRRDYNYITTVCEASKQNVEPFIFNTGPIPKEKVTYVNDTMFYNPKFINTRETRGIVNLNNLRYKVKHKQKLTAYDALDLIWLVKTKIDINREDLVLELTVDIWAKATAAKWILDSIRKNLLIWAGRYLTDKEKIKEFKEAVKMSKIEIKPIEEQIRGARIAGELARAEERGHANGFDEGHTNGFDEGHANGFDEAEEKFVLRLLKTQSPEEISKDFDVSLERIHKIIKDNGNYEKMPNHLQTNP